APSTGKSATAEYLLARAQPRHNPVSASLGQVTFAVSLSNAATVAKKKTVTGRSVVVSRLWASTSGFRTQRKSAAAAAGTPARVRAQRKTRPARTAPS